MEGERVIAEKHFVVKCSIRSAKNKATKQHKRKVQDAVVHNILKWVQKFSTVKDSVPQTKREKEHANFKSSHERVKQLHFKVSLKINNHDLHYFNVFMRRQISYPHRLFCIF